MKKHTFAHTLDSLHSCSFFCESIIAITERSCIEDGKGVKIAFIIRRETALLSCRNYLGSRPIRCEILETFGEMRK